MEPQAYKILSLVFKLFLALQQLSSLEGSYLTVNESEVSYNESVFYDPETQDVISEVPGHTRDGWTFQEILKVDNFALGYSVWREEFGDHCFFRMMMKFERPLILKKVTDEAEAKHEVIDKMKLHQVMIWATPNGNMTEEERSELTDDMNALCQDLPIIKMKTEKVGPEDFEQKKQDAGDCFVSQSGRKKRFAAMARQVCCCCGCHGHRLQKRSNSDEDGEDEHDYSVRTPGDMNDSEEETLEEGEVSWMKNLVHLVIGHKDIGCQ